MPAQIINNNKTTKQSHRNNIVDMERTFSNDHEAFWKSSYRGLRSYANSFSSSSLSSTSSSSSSLVLDSVRGELVEAPAQLFERNKKAAAAERSLEALKNHSEAERRRRARINAHFDTLRRLLPEATKVSINFAYMFFWCVT